MICSGIDVTSGNPVDVEFDEIIQTITPASAPANDFYVAPGFIDVQVNGFAGVDFNNPDATLEELARALDTILATGVTRCLPTVITGSADDMLTCLRNLRRAQRELPRARAISGFHVEGPHIAPEDGPRGAHPARR